MSLYGIDPTLAATLAGTLTPVTPEHVLTAMQAQAAQQQADLAQHTAQASQQAQVAGSQYQSAVAAPTPELDPLAVALPTLFGGIASVLQGSQAPTERAQTSIRDSRAALLKARADNLAALHDVWQQKAEAAQKAGDLEAEAAARSKQETIAKTFELVNSNADRTQKKETATMEEQGRMAREAMGNAAAIEVAKINAAAKGESGVTAQLDYFDSLTRTTRNGNTFLDLTNVPNNPKVRNAALSYAKSKNMMALNINDSSRMVAMENSYENMDAITQAIKGFLPRTGASRLLLGPGNTFGRIFQTNPALGSFGNTKLAAIQGIQALAAGFGSGFRLTNAEVQIAVDNWPKITDDLPTALAKLQWERSWMEHKERALLSRDWRAFRQPTATPWTPTTQPLATPPAGGFFQSNAPAPSR
jgi:hypothetical protein